MLSFKLSIESSKAQLEAIMTSTEERRRIMLEARSDVLAKDVARSAEAVAAEVQAVYDASFDVTLHAKARPPRLPGSMNVIAPACCAALAPPVQERAWFRGGVWLYHRLPKLSCAGTRPTPSRGPALPLGVAVPQRPGPPSRA